MDRLYGSVAEIKAEIDGGQADPHRKAAAVLFGKDPAEIGLNSPERRWAKYLNMAAVAGLSTDGLADLAQAPLGTVREMLERYRRLVLA